MGFRKRSSVVCGLFALCSPFFVVGSSFGSILEGDFITRFEFAQLLHETVCEGCTGEYIQDSARDLFDESWIEQRKSSASGGLSDIRFESASYQGVDYYYCVASAVEKGILSGYGSEDEICAGEYCGEQLMSRDEFFSSTQALVSYYRPSLLEEYTGLCSFASCDIIDGYSPGSAYETIQGTQIKPVMQWLNQKMGCKHPDDFDVDTVLNEVDNCVYTYDPFQKDSDGDGVGDVCDRDIDGDKVENQAGAIDHAGLINSRLYQSSTDKCLKDTDGSLQGDCLVAGSLGIGVEIDNQFGPFPHATTVRVIGSDVSAYDVVWTFGDGTGGRGPEVAKVYNEAGTYTISAVVKEGGSSIAVGSAQVHVLPSLQEQVGYQIDAVGSNEVGSLKSFTTDIYGPAAQVTWSIGDDTDNKSISEEFDYRFMEPGFYIVESQAYNDNGDRVALAQSSVDIGDPDGSNFIGDSKIQVSSLAAQVGGTMTFSTILNDIEQSEVDRVNRYFGDTTEILNGELSEEKIFTKPGVYWAKQVITFVNRRRSPHENVVTVTVLPDSTPGVLGIVLDEYVLSTREQLTASLSLENIQQTEVSSVRRNRGEGGVQTSDFLEETYTYISPGQKIVSATVELQSGEILYADATVSLYEDISCVLGEEYSCDMDNDTIPDMCDDDIDGDDIPNWLGLLLEEPANCDYGPPYDFDLVREQKFLTYTDWIQRGGQGDNCFLEDNEQQEDTDDDGYGNICESGAGGSGDDGGDGNGVETSCNDKVDNDGDGDIDCDDDDCSEDPACQGGGGGGGGSESGGSADDGGDDSGDDDGSTDDGGDSAGSGDDGGDDSGDDDGNPFVEVEVCTACPCPQADYGSALWKGDRVRALLYDEGGAILYRKSAPNVIEVNVPDEMLGIN